MTPGPVSMDKVNQIHLVAIRDSDTPMGLEKTLIGRERVEEPAPSGVKTYSRPMILMHRALTIQIIERGEVASKARIIHRHRAAQTESAVRTGSPVQEAQACRHILTGTTVEKVTPVTVNLERFGSRVEKEVEITRLDERDTVRVDGRLLDGDFVVENNEWGSLRMKKGASVLG